MEALSEAAVRILCDIRGEGSLSNERGSPTEAPLQTAQAERCSVGDGSHRVSCEGGAKPQSTPQRSL